MKQNKVLCFWNLSLAVTSLLGGVFYLFTDYGGRPIVGLGGLAWFAVGVYLLICVCCSNQKAFSIGAGAVGLIQIPIIVCHVTFFGVRPYFFLFGGGELTYASQFGVVIHPLLLIAAVVLTICNFNPAVQTDK